MKILVIDNYDSFVYNLVCMMHNLIEAEIDVIKNNKIDLGTLPLYDKILLSPGPGIPIDAGKMMAILQQNPRTSSDCRVFWWNSFQFTRAFTRNCK